MIAGHGAIRVSGCQPPTSDFASAAVAQLVEHVLGKDEVKGSSPLSSFCGAELLRHRVKTSS